MDFVVDMVNVIMVNVFVIWNLLEIYANKDTVIQLTFGLNEFFRKINHSVLEKDFVKMIIAFVIPDFLVLCVRK
jgi:hypothetical protein